MLHARIIIFTPARGMYQKRLKRTIPYFLELWNSWLNSFQCECLKKMKTSVPLLLQHLFLGSYANFMEQKNVFTCVHEKRVQFVLYTNVAAVSLNCTPIWLPWRLVKTIYTVKPWRLKLQAGLLAPWILKQSKCCSMWLFLEPEWAIDSEAMRARGIIYCFSKIQPVGQK